jgi:hypothetical protein
MDEDDRRPLARFLVIKPDAVASADMRHFVSRYLGNYAHARAGR